MKLEYAEKRVEGVERINLDLKNQENKLMEKKQELEEIIKEQNESITLVTESYENLKEEIKKNV